MPEWFDRIVLGPYGLLTALVLGMLLGGFILVKLMRMMEVRRGRRFRRRGKRAERMAAKLLKKNGFSVIEKEPHIRSDLLIDGELESFDITPDFLVEKAGQSFVVEVKSHGEWSLINQAGVRRQLVEYVYATGLPCILLTTMDNSMLEIQFPPEAKVELPNGSTNG